MLNISDTTFKQLRPQSCFTGKAMREAMNPSAVASRLTLPNWSEENPHNKLLKTNVITVFFPRTHHLRVGPKEAYREVIYLVNFFPGPAGKKKKQME